MKLLELTELLEQFSPLPFAMEWDNSGLQCGKWKQEIKKVMLAVDATDDVVQQVLEEECDLLLTHHPLLFSPLRNITDDTIKGMMLYSLVERGVACYSMHTNYDVTGMGEAAAKRLKLTNAGILEQTFARDDFKAGIGRVGLLPKSMTLKACAEYVKEAFHLDCVRVYGSLRNKIKIAAVCPGSGKGMTRHALKAGADVLITGDIGHHDGLDAVAAGLMVIDAGHFGIEKIFVEELSRFLEKQCPELKVITAKEKAPFVTL